MMKTQIIKFKSNKKLSSIAYNKISDILAEEGINYSTLDFEED